MSTKRFVVILALLIALLIVGAPRAGAANNNYGQILSFDAPYTAFVCGDANSVSYPRKGTRIQAWGCNKHKEEQFELGIISTSAEGYFTIRNSNNMCLNANSGTYPRRGTYLQLWPCQDNRAEDIWRPVNSDNDKNLAIEASGDLQTCLSFGARFPHNGSQMELWTCNGDGAQQIGITGAQTSAKPT
jgi:hypothetical protein